MDWSYLIQAGKEGFSERVFQYSATLGATLGVAINANPVTLGALEGMLTIDNTAVSGAGDNQWVMPISIDLWCTVPGDGTVAAFNLLMDNATSWASGGETMRAVQTSYDTRSGYADRIPKGICHFGDLVLNAASSRKELGTFGLARTADGFTLLDRIHFRFGSLGQSSYGSASVAAAAVHVIDLPPVWIGRQCSLILQPLIQTGSSAASFTVNVTTLELGHPRETA